MTPERPGTRGSGGSTGSPGGQGGEEGETQVVTRQLWLAGPDWLTGLLAEWIQVASRHKR